MENLTIIKIGGNIIDDEAALDSFLGKFKNYPGKKILVHGGGKIATEIGKKLGIVSKYHDGRRITDKATIDLVTMVYAGSINKNLVALLQKIGINSIGLSGADAHLLASTKRPIKDIDYGYVGDLTAQDVNVSFLNMLLAQNITPIICPITLDKEGQLLNTNADTIANCISIAMSTLYSTELFFCFDKSGVLSNVHDEASLIKRLDTNLFTQLKEEKVIADGILPKIQNAINACEQGVGAVYLGKAENLLNANSHEIVGTKIVY